MYDDRHAKLLDLIEKQATASAEQRDLIINQSEMIAKHGEMIGELMTTLKQSP